MLIGPLAHIKRYDKAGRLIGFVIDWSRPGAVERFNAEEKLWWDNHGEDYRGRCPGP